MKYFLPTVIFLLAATWSFAQDQATSLRVYEILQTKCVSCHSNDTPRAGLDLEGSGATMLEKATDVYKNVVGVAPKNSAANAKGYSHIRPGRVDKSFLFKKINNGLDVTMPLEAGEESKMPLSGDLTNVEKELIRQWIIWGAPQQGEVVSEAMLKEYYSGKGEASFPSTPPPAPHPSEGFQLKMGPFFLEPSKETELFLKYQLDNEESIEVNRIEVDMSSFSHHFIIYDYASAASNVPEGLRYNQDHTNDVNFVASVAEPTDLRLPNKTAYFWNKNHVLDLNSHYINYSTDKYYQSEVYINVYTQPKGTAVQQMHSTLIPNFNIPIPNTGDMIKHSAQVIIPPFLQDLIPGQVFMWNIGGHTHRYGAGYKIWTLDGARQKDELIYDGSCPGGIPGCIAPFFDYQHIPQRKWEEFFYVDLENKGMFHEATYINDGPTPVSWGSKSTDEMMLFGVFYVTDTTGLNLNISTATKDFDPIFKEVKVLPNPMQQQATILLPPALGAVEFQLFDMLGRAVRSSKNHRNGYIRVERGILPKGMYLYTLKDEKGRVFTDKLIIGE